MASSSSPTKRASNPATLPPVGFYAHRPSGEFRALHLHRSGRSIDIVYDYRILTLSPPRIFTRIIGGPHSDELHAAIRIRPASVSPPALVAGNLHWLPDPDSSSDLLVFDPVAETFRRMRTDRPRRCWSSTAASP